MQLGGNLFLSGNQLVMSFSIACFSRASWKSDCLFAIRRRAHQPQSGKADMLEGRKPKKKRRADDSII